MSSQKDKHKDTQKKFFSHFPRLDSLLCGSEPCSYDLTKEKTNSSYLNNASKRIFRKLFSGTKDPVEQLTEDEKFIFVLYNEGLILREHIFIRDGLHRKSNRSKDSAAVLTVYDHPVLAICFGFTDRELRENSRILRNRAVLSFYNYSETCPIRAGIDRVLSSNYDTDFEAQVGGVPASLWLETYDPIIQLLLMLNRRRGRRSSLTKRRKHQLYLQPNQPAPIIGDVMQEYFHMVGPPMGHHHHRNIMAVVSFRFGELGERNRFRRHMRIIDPVMTRMRHPNANRLRTTQAHPLGVSDVVDPMQRDNNEPVFDLGHIFIE